MKIKFPHAAPENYHYGTEPYKRNMVRIVLHCDRKFDYNGGKPVKCCWGFFNTKTGTFYRPLNYKEVGKEIEDLKSTTTPYSGMVPPKKTILESFFSD
jgi:hypothetical protein